MPGKSKCLFYLLVDKTLELFIVKKIIYIKEERKREHENEERGDKKR